MKKSIHLTLSLLCSFVVAAYVVGCSKSEDAMDDKSVNVPTQIAALKGQDKEAVQNACGELGKAGALAAPAIPTLIPLLKDQDAVTRRLAAYALARIGPATKAALPDLEALRNDPDRLTGQQAESALKAIDPKKYGGN